MTTIILRFAACWALAYAAFWYVPLINAEALALSIEVTEITDGDFYVGDPRAIAKRPENRVKLAKAVQLGKLAESLTWFGRALLVWPVVWPALRRAFSLNSNHEQGEPDETQPVGSVRADERPVDDRGDGRIGVSGVGGASGDGPPAGGVPAAGRGSRSAAGRKEVAGERSSSQA